MKSFAMIKVQMYVGNNIMYEELKQFKGKVNNDNKNSKIVNENSTSN